MSRSSAEPTPAVRSPPSSPTSGPASGSSKPVPCSFPQLTPASRGTGASFERQGMVGSHRHEGPDLEGSGEQFIVRFSRGDAVDRSMSAPCSSRSAGRPTSTARSRRRRGHAATLARSPSTTTCVPTSSTSSPPVTSTGDPAGPDRKDRGPPGRPECHPRAQPPARLRRGAKRQLHRPGVRRGRPDREPRPPRITTSPSA